MNGGRMPTGRDAVEWVARGRGAGAGEILLTSMDRDGTEDGYELALTRAVVGRGGGAGDRQRRRRQARTTWSRRSQEGGADAVLCASIFHYGQYSVREAKERMRDAGIPVRL